MRNFVLILVILFFASPCMAFQNYLVMTDHPITKVKVGCEKIITVEHIQDLNCKSNTLLIVPQTLGATKLSFCKGKKRICLKVTVYENLTCIRHVNGVKLVPVDLPAELK